jgi:hypothetical protein
MKKFSHHNISNWLKNCGLLFVSISLILVVLEGVIFRYVFIPAELPLLQETESSESILKFIPNQTGIYRKHDEISAKFRINSNGWNSRHDLFLDHKNIGETRICIIGDSYIEALQVDFDKSVAEVLEDQLDKSRTKVYRLGISGAPLSQYLYMLEKEALLYQPDIVVLNLAHNDFDESLFGTGGSYDVGFAKFGYKESGSLGRIDPGTYERNFAWWIKRSGIYRYWRVRKEARIDNLKTIWFRVFGPPGGQQEQQYVANIEVERSRDRKINDVIKYAFTQLASSASKNRFRPIILIDGDRSAIMSSLDTEIPSNSSARYINDLVVTAGFEYGIEVIDLWPLFEDYHKSTGMGLTFDHDGHWPQHVHKLVGITLAAYLRETTH